MSQLEFKDCSVHWTNNKITLENSRIKRTLRIKNKRFYTDSFVDKNSDKEWVLPDQVNNDFSYAGLLEKHDNSSVSLLLKNIVAKVIKNNIFQNDCILLTVNLYEPVQKIELFRDYYLYPEVSALATRVRIKSPVVPNFGHLIVGYKPKIQMKSLENNIVNRIQLNIKDYNLRCVQFCGRTDYTNDIVIERNITKKNKKDISLLGNLLFIQDKKDKNGLFIAQEAPPSWERRRESQEDFMIQGSSIKSLGWGILPNEFKDSLVKSYVSVLGVYSKNFDYGQLEFKRYFNGRFKNNPKKNYMIMANPWGGGDWYKKINNKFIEKEIKTCREAGINQYQIDDGWQSYGTLKELSINNMSLDKESWAIRKDIFPNGFKEMAVAAKKYNVDICLWFAPSFNKNYRDWKEQVEVLFELYKKYKIKIFKIDAVITQNKEAEENLEKLFRNLRIRSEGEIYFNLDTTNGMRPGYMMFLEYGNIFLENRYYVKTGQQYHPWQTLCNLWMLSKYIPTQRLQVEFLDIRKTKKDVYPDKDLCPSAYSQEYVTAITMFANPLFWGNPSEFSTSAKLKVKKILELHKKYRKEIFSGNVLPIGQKPSGYSWTGFQSHNFEKKSGFIIVYRELNKKQENQFKLKFLEGKTIRLKSLSDNSKNIVFNLYKNAKIKIRLEKQNTFRLYQYECK